MLEKKDVGRFSPASLLFLISTVSQPFLNRFALFRLPVCSVYSQQNYAQCHVPAYNSLFDLRYTLKVRLVHAFSHSCEDWHIPASPFHAGRFASVFRSAVSWTRDTRRQSAVL